MFPGGTDVARKLDIIKNIHKKLNDKRSKKLNRTSERLWLSDKSLINPNVEQKEYSARENQLRERTPVPYDNFLKSI